MNKTIEMDYNRVDPEMSVLQKRFVDVVFS